MPEDPTKWPRNIVKWMETMMVRIQGLGFRTQEVRGCERSLPGTYGSGGVNISTTLGVYMGMILGLV